MDDCKTDDFTRDANKLNFEMSKDIILTSVYWKSEYLSAQNATGFYPRDTDEETVKKVIFYNNLVPTKERFDSIEKCYGRGGFVFEQCIGYIENGLVNMCSGCQELLKDQVLQIMKAKIEAKNKTIESLKNRVSLLEDLKSLNKTRIKNGKHNIHNSYNIIMVQFSFFQNSNPTGI